MAIEETGLYVPANSMYGNSSPVPIYTDGQRYWIDKPSDPGSMEMLSAEYVTQLKNAQPTGVPGSFGGVYTPSGTSTPKAVDMSTLGYHYYPEDNQSVPGAAAPGTGNDIRQEKGWFRNPQGQRFFREGGVDYTDDTKTVVINTLESNMSLRGDRGEWISPEEQFRKEQFNILQEEQTLEDELEPFILGTMGLERDPVSGKIRELPPAPLTAEQIEEQRLENLYKEHLTAAQEGRLPVSLATMEKLSRQEKELDEAMSRRLGTKWKESTPGAVTAGDYLLSSEAVKEAERHDDLNRASSLLNQRQASLSDITQRQLGGMQGMGSPSYSLVNSYGTSQQPYLFKNLLNVRMENQESANRAADTAGIYSLIGAGAGGAATYYMANRDKPSQTTSGGYNNQTYGSPLFSDRYAISY